MDNEKARVVIPGMSFKEIEDIQEKHIANEVLDSNWNIVDNKNANSTNFVVHTVRSDIFPLTKDRLENIFMRLYETAYKDANKPNIFSHYPAFFTFAFPILFARFTNDFKPAFGLSAESVSNIWLCVGVLSFVAGLVFMIIYFYKKTSNEAFSKARDIAISNEMNKIIESGEE